MLLTDAPQAAVQAALPRLTEARAALTHEVAVVNEWGEERRIAIPAERALTVYVDKRELVTLMTLGLHPEWLVLGYLRNQRLVDEVCDIESITVDWSVGAAAVRTRRGLPQMEARTAKRVVTTGCGQGSVLGGLLDELERIQLPATAQLRQSELYQMVKVIREQPSTYKSAGSVHGCGLFRGGFLHHGPADQRNGDPVGPDGRAGGGFTQRHDANGAGRGRTGDMLTLCREMAVQVDMDRA